MFNSAKIGNMWVSKEAKLIMHIAVFIDKFVLCLEFSF